MIKQILRLLFLLAMYELGKYVTEQVYIMMTANDDVEVPSDFAKLHTYLTHTLLVRIIVLVFV
ncbi:phage transcriptional activator RinB [Staphylococcus aureus M1347]|nr:phage transcriptional activator RinB [Staphylococcus aureus M1347]